MLQVVDGSETIDVNGRVAAMVRWLASNIERITTPQKVQVTFDCAGSTVSAEVRERERVDPAFLR